LGVLEEGTMLFFWKVSFVRRDEISEMALATCRICKVDLGTERGLSDSWPGHYAVYDGSCGGREKS
jgi:hypothetical protein